MSKESELSYTTLKAYSTKIAFVAAVADDLAEQNVDHSIIFTWVSGKWTKKPVPNAVVAMCTIASASPQLFNICATGEVVVFSTNGFSDERIAADGDPSHLLSLRTGCVIGDAVYAAGMARRVFRRDAPGQWRAMDAGVFVQREQRKAGVGFLCMDGFNSTDIYAAGYKGEIWHYDGNEWTQEESPTNVALTTLRCGPDESVYVAGLAGTLLRGRRGVWEALKNDTTTDDFWGAAIFREVPYFATSKAIYRLAKTGLERVNSGVTSPISTAKLDCNSEVLWSVGAKDIARTQDGSRWELVEGPS